MGAKTENKLSDRQVKTLKEPGLYNDGGGLYLQVKGGSRSWLFFFQWDGKRREMGLGPVSGVGLAKARDRAREARGLVADGINPIAARNVAADAQPVAIPTFKDFGLAMIDQWRDNWKNPKHIDQWRKTINDYCNLLADKLVSDIGTGDVLAVLRPLWLKMNETASRVRGRIERILDAAKVAGHRAGENPARWKGHLALILAKRKKLKRGHHSALGFHRMPALMAWLQANGSISAMALEFLILTWARTSEVRLARRREIDRTAGVWVIPAERMKMGRTHRVPLSRRAVQILDKVWRLANDDDNFVFPGGSEDGCLSQMAMAMLLRDFVEGGEKATVHGFRSTAKDWSHDHTRFPRELTEAALAHKVGDDTEQAYLRTDALERRRELMDAWAKAVAPPIAA